MYPDYISSIVATYDNFKTANALASRLVDPTPAMIKDQCKTVFIDRYERRDEETLRIFFGHVGDMETLVQTIARCDPDKFKPLVKFLRNQTDKTDKKNIELLAWLIDYRPRPFEYGRNYEPLTKSPKTPGDDRQTGKPKEGTQGRQQGSINRLWQMLCNWFTEIRNESSGRKIIIAGAVLLFMAGSGYWLSKDKFLSAGVERHEACMYWTGDHYEQISCNPHHDTLVVALDIQRLNSFRRITRKDTITLWSLGKVWYNKKNNEVDFFTSNGLHPVDPQRKLRLATPHMIKVYCMGIAD